MELKVLWKLSCFTQHAYNCSKLGMELENRNPQINYILYYYVYYTIFYITCIH